MKKKVFTEQLIKARKETVFCLYSKVITGLMNFLLYKSYAQCILSFLRE